MSRGGMTLAEGLVAMVIVAVVLGGALSLVRATGGMSEAGDLEFAMQQASLTLVEIERDLGAAAPRPLPGEVPVRVHRDGFDVVVAVARSDGRIDGQLVRYERQGADDAHRLKRTAGASSRVMPGTFRALHVALLGGAGGRYVRVTLHVSARDASRGSAAVSTLVRLGNGALAGVPLYDWSFMDGLKQVALP